MERQTAHLLRLVDDLLDLSRITRGLVRLDVERVALAEVLDGAFEVVSPLIDRERHTLHVDLEPDLVIEADITVEAFSDGPQRGAELVIRLPAMAAGTARISREITAATPRSHPGVGLGVLIVDDNEDAAILLGEALTQRGYTIRVVHDGPNALAIIDEYAPHAALLDIGLPVMDGYEVSRQLRLGHPPERLRLIVITGYGQPSDRERSRNAGFDEHLVKPVSVIEVDAVLRKLRADG